MKKGIFLSLFISMFLINLDCFSQDELTAEIKETPNLRRTEVQAINFRQVGEISELEIVVDNNKVPAKKFAVVEDKQIIIDIKNTKATERVMRAFDTSEFSGSVVFVSAYPKPGAEEDLRIAIQLRDNVRSILKRRANRVVLEVENRFGVFDQRDISEAKSFEEKVTEKDVNVGKLLVPKGDSVEDILENLTLSGRKKYIGSKFSLNVKDVAVTEILKMIAEASGFNIITTDEIKALPPLTLSLTNVPWDQALDTILALNNLVAKKNGIILMVQTLETATKEKQKEVEAKSLTLKQEPLVTKVFPISYSQTTTLITILTEYLTPERGRIAEDQRTNSLIVKDTPDVIEKIRKIIDTLDTQTPQVLIESRIVEVSESYSKALGLENGLGLGYDPIGAQSTSSPTGIGVSGQPGTANSGPGFAFNTAGGIIDRNNNNGVLNLSVSQFGRVFDLNFRLQLLETESKGKIISSPKVVTQNKQPARLVSKRTEAYLVINGAGDTATTGAETAEAILNLTVTPQITNEGSISLQVNIQKEDFAERINDQLPPNKTSNQVETVVLVDNGATVVIGGVYEYVKRETISGVPYLKDIPILGWLFRNQWNPSTTKREIIIFITPRIINQEEAGLIERS